MTAAQEPADATAEPAAGGYVQDEAAGDLTLFALDVLAVLPSLL